MQPENALPKMIARPIQPVQFVGTLVEGEKKVPVTVTIDASGAVLKIKQGDITLNRNCWVNSSMGPDQLVLVAYGYGYEDWVKKLKFESKNPGQNKADLTSQTKAWTITFKSSKLGNDLVQQVAQNVQQVDFDIYLSNQKSPEKLYIVGCPHCSQFIDVTPYSDSENLFCNSCSKLFSEELTSDSMKAGICPQCAYYTKLRKGDNLCYPCNSKNTISAFFYSILVAFGILAVNVLTIVFLDRFFPILLVIAGVSFLWSMLKFVSMITVSVARKATGTTPLEQSTAALRKGKTDQAMQLIKSIPDAEKNPGILLNLARGLINEGNHQKACQFADLLIEQYPNFQYGYAARVESLTLSGAPQEEVQAAVEQLNQVIGRNMLRTQQQLQRMGIADSLKASGFKSAVRS